MSRSALSSSVSAPPSWLRQYSINSACSAASASLIVVGWLTICQSSETVNPSVAALSITVAT
ncbi:hypothetical protein [Rhodococcus opacus]|uniref:hypothetical protein n=1 Tax=Rhodococcus opacus TaxID=37919 RepID=UPI001F0AEA79|nr:hypothetical protein [Rhodococcus opacus]